MSLENQAKSAKIPAFIIQVPNDRALIPFWGAKHYGKRCAQEQEELLAQNQDWKAHQEYGFEVFKRKVGLGWLNVAYSGLGLTAAMYISGLLS